MRKVIPAEKKALLPRSASLVNGKRRIMLNSEEGPHHLRPQLTSGKLRSDCQRMSKDVASMFSRIPEGALAVSASFINLFVGPPKEASSSSEPNARASRR